MSEFETTRVRMLSRLETIPHNGKGSLGHSGNEPTKSTEKDIFRYSYNLGKQRTKQIHRAASLAAETYDDKLSKALLHRRTLPRSMSVESESALNYDTRGIESIQDITLESKKNALQFSTLKSAQTEKQTMESNTGDFLKANITGESLDKNIPKDKLEKAIISDSNECQENETILENKDSKTTEMRSKLISVSDSVPDLRLVGKIERANFESEGFSRFLTPISTAEKAQSRPICKLRRAARRLGVSLSSEEIYHKQRRNGVCTETDDAADNRKLLRVLNKRF